MSSRRDVVMPVVSVGGMVELMKALISVLLAVWILVSLLGAVIEGMLWLLVIGLVLLVATAAYGWFRLRRRSGRT